MAQSITFTQVRPGYFQITSGQEILGMISPSKDEESGEISYMVTDDKQSKIAAKSCESVNQAKAFAELHFGKEVQP